MGLGHLVLTAGWWGHRAQSLALLDPRRAHSVSTATSALGCWGSGHLHRLHEVSEVTSEQESHQARLRTAAMSPAGHTRAPMLCTRTRVTCSRLGSARCRAVRGRIPPASGGTQRCSLARRVHLEPGVLGAAPGPPPWSHPGLRGLREAPCPSRRQCRTSIPARPKTRGLAPHAWDRQAAGDRTQWKPRAGPVQFCAWAAGRGGPRSATPPPACPTEPSLSAHGHRALAEPGQAGVSRGGAPRSPLLCSLGRAGTRRTWGSSQAWGL